MSNSIREAVRAGIQEAIVASVEAAMQSDEIKKALSMACVDLIQSEIEDMLKTNEAVVEPIMTNDEAVDSIPQSAIDALEANIDESVAEVSQGPATEVLSQPEQDLLDPEEQFLATMQI